MIGAGHLLVAFSERDYERLEESRTVQPQSPLCCTRPTSLDSPHRQVCALITGTGVGMGRATALRFAATGATVVGRDLNPETSPETVQLVQAAGGTMTAQAPVDLSWFEATKQWIDEAATSHGGIDVLYNNASLPVVGPWDDLTVEGWHTGIRNELDLVFYACKIAWPHLVRGGRASSTLPRSPRSASRVLPAGRARCSERRCPALTYHLAAAGGPHRIRVNANMPGLIRTPSTESCSPRPMLRAACLLPATRSGEWVRPTTSPSLPHSWVG